MMSETIESSEPIALDQCSPEVIANNYFIDTVQKNYSMYLSKCIGYVKCPNIAEDAVQEGVLAAHQRLDSLKNQHSLPAWLYRIIIHKAIDLLHKKNRLALLDDHVDLVSYNKYGFLNDSIWAAVPSPEEEAINSEGIEQIKIALESLDNAYRVPLLLKDFEGFSIKETAEIMQISETNTKVRIHRARIKLKAKLNGYFYPEK